MVVLNSGFQRRPRAKALRVSSPVDRTEREADQISRRIVARKAVLPLDFQSGEAAQRRGSDNAHDEFLPHGGGNLRRPVWGISSDIWGLGAGQPLSADLRSYFEPHFGADLSNLRLHTGSRAGALAERISAQAFTYKQHIVFSAGAYRPSTGAGRQLLAHELAHAVQQSKTGASSASIQRQASGFSRADFDEFSQEELDEFLSESRGLEPTGEEARRATGEAQGRSVNRPAVMSCTPKSPMKQYLRKKPTPAAGTNVLTTLDLNDRVYVTEVGGHADQWFRIRTAAGLDGWVPTASVALDPPEPSAEIYRIQPGDTALNLASRWYGPTGGFKRWWEEGSDPGGDARFYVAALALANKGRAGMPSPRDLTKRPAWSEVGLKEQHTIWRPSKSFLRSLRTRVSSGSISKELWEDVKAVAKAAWDWAVVAAAFLAGLVYGAGESIYDLFAGAVEIIKMIWNVIKSIFTGTILADAENLWNDIKGIKLSSLTDEFLRHWNADDTWDRGFFRGRVVGYVIMEIVLLLVSGGALTAIKWGGKFAKIGALIGKLPRVQKLAQAARAATTLPSKATDALKARFAARLGKGARITKGLEKGKPAIETILKSAEHVRKRSEAFKKYIARGGKKSEAAYNAIYDSLTRNRLVGKLAEEQFQLVMKGSPRSYWVTVGGKRVLRKVDNVVGNVAREVKSGPLRLTPFIERQILKDMELIRTTFMKVEWHLLAGGDAKAIAALKKAGIKVVPY